MKCQVLKIQQKPSYRGGIFYWYFMKDLESGKSLRTCTSPEFRNWYKWSGIKNGDILTNCNLRGKNMVDADSDIIIEREK